MNKWEALAATAFFAMIAIISTTEDCIRTSDKLQCEQQICEIPDRQNKEETE